jgi:hypothetical protein
MHILVVLACLLGPYNHVFTVCMVQQVIMGAWARVGAAPGGL